jgi:hypothetical protein
MATAEIWYAEAVMNQLVWAAGLIQKYQLKTHHKDKIAQYLDLAQAQTHFSLHMFLLGHSPVDHPALDQISTY